MEVYRALGPAQPLEAGGRARARTASSSPRTSSPRRRPPNCARTRRTRIPCRPTRCSTTSCDASSSRRCASPRSSRRGYDLETVEEGRAPALPRRIQAPPVGAGREGHAQEFRPRPPLPDRQPLPRPGARATGRTRPWSARSASRASVRWMCDGSISSGSGVALGCLASAALPYALRDPCAAGSLRHRASCPSPSSASPRPRPGTSISATPARPCSTRSSRGGRAAPSSCASTIRISRARSRNLRDAIEIDLAWLGIPPDVIVRQSERFALYDAAAERLQGAGRLYACYETPDELDFRRKRQLARGLPPIYDRAALKLTDDDRAALEAEGRRPHWRFRLDHETVRLERPRARRLPRRLQLAVRSGAGARGRHLSLHAALRGRRYRPRHHRT